MATLAKATKLNAVNTIISNVGQSPVTTLESGNPLVETAEQILDEVTRSVQADGWVFNSEFHYTFAPDANNEIVIPTNVLQLDTSNHYEDRAVIRSGKLYNKTDHSYTWKEKVDLDVVWLFEFEDLPEAFKNYVAIRAANVFAGRTVGSKEAVRFGEREELLARAAAIEYDTSQGDYSIFADRNDNQTYVSYLPYNAVGRWNK